MRTFGKVRKPSNKRLIVVPIDGKTATCEVWMMRWFAIEAKKI